MMSEFSAVAMNFTAVEKCRVIREAFSEALTAIKQHVKPGRELALVTTKMQEACMWAIRGVAMDPANQHPTQPGSVPSQKHEPRTISPVATVDTRHRNQEVTPSFRAHLLTDL